MYAYAMRHAYVTDAIAAGLPDAMVAELAGHADTRMISTYTHVKQRGDLLAAARVRGDGSDTGDIGSR